MSAATSKNRNNNMTAMGLLDPELTVLLEQVENVNTSRQFRRWRKTFLDKFEKYLYEAGIKSARKAYEELSFSLTNFTKLVRKVNEYVDKGDLTVKRYTVKARMCLSEMSKKLDEVNHELDSLIPQRSSEEKQRGYNKFHMGAVLIRDKFQEYNRLSICADLLQHMRDVSLNEVADKQILGMMDYYSDRLEKFCDIMASLGLFEVMKKCLQYANEQRDETNLIFLDLKTGGIGELNRLDCIEKGVIKSKSKDANGNDVFAETATSIEAKSKLTKMVFVSPKLGLGFGLSKNTYKDEDLELDAEMLRAKWGVALKKAPKNKKGEELLFIDQVNGAFGELSRTNCIEQGVIGEMEGKDKDGKPVTILMEAEDDQAERLTLVELVRTILTQGVKAAQEGESKESDNGADKNAGGEEKKETNGNAIAAVPPPALKAEVVDDKPWEPKIMKKTSTAATPSLWTKKKLKRTGTDYGSPIKVQKASVTVDSPSTKAAFLKSKLKSVGMPLTETGSPVKQSQESEKPSESPSTKAAFLKAQLKSTGLPLTESPKKPKHDESTESADDVAAATAAALKANLKSTGVSLTEANKLKDGKAKATVVSVPSTQPSFLKARLRSTPRLKVSDAATQDDSVDSAPKQPAFLKPKLRKAPVTPKSSQIKQKVVWTKLRTTDLNPVSTEQPAAEVDKPTLDLRKLKHVDIDDGKDKPKQETEAGKLALDIPTLKHVDLKEDMSKPEDDKEKLETNDTSTAVEQPEPSASKNEVQSKDLPESDVPHEKQETPEQASESVPTGEKKEPTEIQAQATVAKEIEDKPFDEVQDAGAQTPKGQLETAEQTQTEATAEELKAKETTAENPTAEPKAEEKIVEEPKEEEPKLEELITEPKVEEPKSEEPKVEKPLAEEPITEEPLVKEPKPEEPKPEEPIPEDPKAKAEEPKAEEPKVEEPKAEEPKAEEPKAEEPKAEEPKAKEPKAKEPKAEEPIVEMPVVEEHKEEEPQAEEPQAEEPTAEEPTAEEPIAEEPIAEEPIAEEPIAEEPIAEELIAEEPIAEEPIAEEPKAEEPNAEEPIVEEPVVEMPVVVMPVVEEHTFLEHKVEEPQAEEPKVEEPKPEEPKVEEPKPEEPIVEEPKVEVPKAEEPKAEEPKAEDPKVEELKAEEPKAEEPKAEEPKAEEPKAQEPKAREPEAEESKEEEPKVEELKAKEPNTEEQISIEPRSEEEIVQKQLLLTDMPAEDSFEDAVEIGVGLKDSDFTQSAHKAKMEENLIPVEAESIVIESNAEGEEVPESSNIDTGLSSQKGIEDTSPQVEELDLNTNCVT